MDTDEYWGWNASTLSWTKVGDPTGSTGYATITADGETIGEGVTNVAVEADSALSIKPSIARRSDMRIFNSKGFVTTISPPAGWSFSTGEDVLRLGWWESVELHYYVDQVILVGPKNGGMAQ